MNHYATIRTALESIRACDDALGERDAALSALAELEKAVSNHVARVVDEPSPIPVYVAFDTPYPPVGSKLYTAPPAIAAARADAEIAELRRDAERYRWLRMNRLWLKGKLPILAAPEFDTAIDSAIDAVRGGE